MDNVTGRAAKNPVVDPTVVVDLAVGPAVVGFAHMGDRVRVGDRVRGDF